MTNMPASVTVVPAVQVKFPDEAAPISVSLLDLVREGETLETALGWNDAELKRRMAGHLDRSVTIFTGLAITRPETGNILISKPAEYGAEIAS